MDTGTAYFARVSDAYVKPADARRLVVVLRGSFDLLKGGVTVKEKEGIVVGMTFSNFPLCRVGQLERDMAHHGFSREKAMSE